ncbi:MAG TPA: hypothetical protein DCX32_02180 [Candidatus Moranbacteria bacterium]|nr:hypothetical protein [Candidatus Moranbacteria bacterium]
MSRLLLIVLLFQKSTDKAYYSREVIMLIGLAGLHGAGKTNLAHLLQKRKGWNYLNKRDVLIELYKETGDIFFEKKFMDWYRGLYVSLGSFEVMSLIMAKSFYVDTCITVVDAIHGLEEWKAVKKICPRAILVGVFSPKEVRRRRNDPGDDVLDKKRISYWHERLHEGYEQCLLAEVEWAFSGVVSIDIQGMECDELEAYIMKRVYE